MKSISHSRRKTCQRGADGYVLLTLLLTIALIAIFAAAIVPSITFDIKRDREAEMIHRGTQYSRAIRAYFKKFGRYPTKIEDLESSNNQRFLRKRYKDPLNCLAATCQDFKLLHFGEVQLSLSGIGAGNIPGANPVGAAPGSSALNQGSSFNQGQGSTFGQNSSFGNSNSFGQNQQPQNQQSTSDQAGTPDTSQTGPGGTNSATQPVTGSDNPADRSSPNQQVIIGGPIVGVASATKDADPTIREFNHKKKYKDWVFVYDPAQDRGQLITTPYQPIQLGQQQNLNGTSGSGINNSGTGQPPAGMQNNPNLPSSGGFGNPVQPSNPPQPPQQ